MNEAVKEAKKIDSYYLLECTVPPLIESENAELKEVVAVYYETLTNFLDCHTRHKGLVQQVDQK